MPRRPGLTLLALAGLTLLLACEAHATLPGACNLTTCAGLECVNADAGNCIGACVCTGGINLASLKPWSKCQCFKYIGGPSDGPPVCAGDIECMQLLSEAYGLDRQFQLLGSSPSAGQLQFGAVLGAGVHGLGWNVVVAGGTVFSPLPNEVSLDGTLRSVLQALAEMAGTSIRFDEVTHTIYVPAQ